MHTPRPARLDLRQASDRNRSASHVVSGFARATPALADQWRQIERSLSDVPVLVSEVTRLRTEVGAVRLDRANLAAAVLAALAASQDGEPGSLSYLPAQGFLPEHVPARDHLMRRRDRGRG